MNTKVCIRLCDIVTPHAMNMHGKKCNNIPSLVSNMYPRRLALEEISVRKKEEKLRTMPVAGRETVPLGSVLLC